ncbi:three-helix bundle dimerization domain-containing protein [Phytohabitans suffuscus]|uniref:Protein-tyrosine-phosphatase-like N-terminal domain-containing protein n=1 Tax=Phytohabitans suffuscus TaxID=624315 RepID=A0A6F8YTQ0_9ACTN|nr:hypothetical protein [Phytohabitans suffuscus]BCB89555.1 hypothetical protein Psuf_068680 [Phytohabitans suffuscus]
MPEALLDDQERERLRARLVVRYAGVHGPERVREVIAEVYRGFAGARVHTYVPVLAERAVREILDAEARTRTVRLPRRAAEETLAGAGMSIKDGPGGSATQCGEVPDDRSGLPAA